MTLNLPLEQVPSHQPTRNSYCPPHRWQVNRTKDSIGEPERKHGWNPAPGILQSKAPFQHLVLLHLACLQKMD